MTRKEYCHRLADLYAALHDFENELKEIKRKTIMENNPERKMWSIDAQKRLLREKDELEEKLKQFISKNGSVF